MTPEEIKQVLSGDYAKAEEEWKHWLQDLFGRLGLQEVPLLYQYTNMTGLKGMISESELWATNVAYCNDSSEFHYGIGKFIEVINANISDDVDSVQHKIATDLVARLKQQNRSDTYICCLTKNEDQLSQWRGYGDRGYGYSVGFDFKDVTNLHGVTSHAWVVYDKDEHVEMCQKMSVENVNVLVQSLPADVVNDAAAAIADMVMEDICGGLPYFKHPLFAEEEEYRLFSSVAEVAKRQGTKDFPVFVREGQNMLVPFVKLTHSPTRPKTRLPIRRIIVGPKVDFDKAEQSIRLLLSNNKYPDDIKIVPSPIPFV